MRDVAIPFAEVQDPQGLNMPDKNLSRDPARTPMQWNNKVNAGFTEGKPWLRIHKSYTRQNVDTEKDNPHSMLALYHNLIKLRQREPALNAGNYTPVYSDSQMIAYLRESEVSDSFLILLNLTHRPCYFTPPHFAFAGDVVLASSAELEGQYVENTISLEGDEGVIIRVKK